MAHIRRVAIAHARASLKDIVEDVRKGQERVKLTRYNRTLAGIVSAADLHILDECKRALAEREKASGKSSPAAEPVRKAVRRGRRG
jgi:prevent-host-death family protein